MHYVSYIEFWQLRQENLVKNISICLAVKLQFHNQTSRHFLDIGKLEVVLIELVGIDRSVHHLEPLQLLDLLILVE